MATFSPFAGTTLSTTYDLPSPYPHSSITPRSTSDDDDDEIVWNVSEGDIPELEGDENYRVLTKPQSDLSTSVEDEATKLLEMKMNSLSLSSKAATKTAKQKAKNPKRSKKATTSFVQGTTTNDKRSVGNAYPSPKQADVVQAISAIGLGQRPIVDDLSEQLSVVSGDKTPTLYEEASTYISSFLSNPDARIDDVCRLTLLQSLIIELGLATSSALPSSMRAAKAFLKAHAFLNIREYIAVRGQGPEAVQSVMYPSKSALIKSIKKKRNAISIKMVKELGLQVLLVGCMR